MARRTVDLTGYGLPYWLDIERPVYPELQEQIRADAAIIGGGIAGLKIAAYLARHDLSSVVLEGSQIGAGASTRNQGCIVTGLSVPYGELVEQTSRSVARSTRFAAIFPHLSGTRITHRWGGLQSFTFDGLPEIGLFDPQRRIHGMAGFSGLGNSFSNVGGAYLADRAAGICGAVEQRFAAPLELLLAPGRDTAKMERPKRRKTPAGKPPSPGRRFGAVLPLQIAKLL